MKINVERTRAGFTELRPKECDVMAVYAVLLSALSVDLC